MGNLINMDILRNPMNWLTISVMLIFIGMCAMVIHSHMTKPAQVMPDNVAKES